MFYSTWKREFNKTFLQLSKSGLPKDPEFDLVVSRGFDIRKNNPKFQPYMHALLIFYYQQTGDMASMGVHLGELLAILQNGDATETIGKMKEVLGGAVMPAVERELGMSADEILRRIGNGEPLR